MRMPATTLKTAVILWEDSITADSGWLSREEAIAWAKAYDQHRMVTTGLLIERTKEYVLVTSIEDPSTGRLGPLVRIPAGCIKKLALIPVGKMKVSSGPSRKAGRTSRGSRRTSGRK